MSVAVAPPPTEATAGLEPVAVEAPAPPGEPAAATRTTRPWLVAAGPYLVCLLQLLLGYVHYAPGTAYSLSADHYRAWAFPAFSYSDIVWLWLRDGLDRRPFPYLDYPLEYPPLTGLVSWAASFAPDLPGYFLVAYVVLSAAMLATVWALDRLPGANPWYVAAAPAVFFYTGHQWDPLAIGITALALMVLARGNDRLGALGLAAAVSLKLFPVAFLAALCAERVAQRAWRRLAEIVAIAAGVTLAANLPFALANPDGWGFFFRWNRDRLADSGPWVLLRGAPTEALTSASMVAAVAGAAMIALWAMRIGGPLVVPLGSTALLWWLLVNKTFTTHLILWVFLAVALLRPPLWVWIAVVLVDLGGFQLGNYLNLYNIPLYQSAPLVQQAVERMYDPLQIARSLVLLVCVGWGLRVLWRGRGITPALAASPTGRRRAHPSGIDDLFAPRRTRPTTTTWRIAAIAGPIVLFTAASVAISWPVAANARIGTVVGFDPLLQIWLSRWVQHALATNPLGLWSGNIFHPFPDTLAYTDANIPGALLAWPVDLLVGDPLLTNAVMIVIAGAIGGLGVALVVDRLAGNRAAGVIAGLAYVALPFRAVHLWHLNWLQGAWLPWVLYAFLRVLERPTTRRGAVLGGAVGVLVLTSFYFALQVAILLGGLGLAALVADRRLRTRAAATSLAVAVAVAGLLIGPAVGPYLRVRAEQGLERNLADAEQYKASPASYLTLAPWDEPNPLQRLLGVRPGENEALTTVGQARHADGHRHGEIVNEDALYPGYVVVLLAGAGLTWSRRRWIVAGLAAAGTSAFVLSLGPSLGDMSSEGIVLPYRWLFDHLPGFTAMRVTARLGGLAGLVLVLLAGLGVAALWRRIGPMLDRQSARLGGLPPHLVPAVAATLAAVLVVGDLVSGAVPIESIDRAPEARKVYDWLASQPSGVVMEFPAESIFLDPAGSSVRRHVGLSMFWSTVHWQPLVNGNSGFIPRAHSELLETFVGNLRRDDGSLALRVSHVATDRAPLLRQLGVRYLVFHRSQYRAEDWPAVVAALESAAGDLRPAGDFGEASVWLVREPIGSPPRPDLSLFAPTLLAPGDGWSPAIAVENRASGPSLLSLTRPARIAIAWYDGAGRFIRQDAFPTTLPPIVASGQTICTVAGCRTAAGAAFPDDLPDPSQVMWRPQTPGHYTARVTLSGDRPLSCLIDLDVVDSATDAVRLANDNPLRWAECTESNGVPVNAPGDPTFRMLGPSVTFADDAIALSATLQATADEEVRGWFLLASPGDPQPWKNPSWKSPEVQRLVEDGEPMTFSWLERPALEPGVYGLSIWFHHAVSGRWTHAEGGAYGLPPVIVDAGGGMRWAGPARLHRSAPVGRLAPGRSTPLPLAVASLPADADCTASWSLVDDRGGRVASGGAGACETARVALPAAIPSGRYILRVDAYASRDGTRRLSDGVAMPVVVGQASGGPR